MKLKDKVAIVTGGARGIGAAICKRYAAEGARVVVADILEQEAAATARAIGGGAFAIGLDVTRRSSIDGMVEAVVGKAGKIDVLVNNAAIFDMAPVLEITEASFDKQFAINVKGLLFTLQAVAAQMVKQGEGGKIINFASQAGRRGEPLVTVYCATKAAVISITQSTGLALIKQKINVNAIAPGVIDTPMWDVVDSQFAKYENLPIGEKKKQVGRAVPYGRMGVPEDIVGAALFLASADADYIVAQTLNVDGGNVTS
jgi:D-sorbitol dehydrogenase (acceptor)